MRTVLPAALLLVLAACGSETSTPSGGAGGNDPTDPTTSGEAVGRLPADVPPPDGPVIARTTVLDRVGPQLCLGALLESLPPQCDGVPITGWEWSAFHGASDYPAEGAEFYAVNDVRWGEFEVVGRYDGTTLALDRATPLSQAEPKPPRDRDPLTTRCPEPEGGWRVVDPTKVSMGDQDAAFARARRLDGYAGSFIDMSRDPRSPEELDQGLAEGTEGADDASRWVVNVGVTGDVAAAGAELRKIWGGPLCVFRAEHTEADLLRIQRELQALPGILSGSSHLDRVYVTVVWDDGTLQAWADQTYGDGLVRIHSALRMA